MSKFQKILLGAFCVGVLLCGMGAGITFTEFSSLAYGGEKILGGGKLTTKEIDVEFEPGENSYSVFGYYDNGYSEILTDEAVPENTIRFEVSYNAARVEPHPYVDKESAVVALDWYWKDVNEMELLMEAKDQVLAELKEGKISFYDVEGVKEVRILVNPVNEEDVRMMM